MSSRGIRGATTIQNDHPAEIIESTQELLHAVLAANPALETQDIASVIFTVSEGISSAYPARAAREMGWVNVPLLCMQEIDIPGGLKRCIRILIHWNTHLEQDQIRHIYLKEAVTLRPDIANANLEEAIPPQKISRKEEKR